MSPEQEWFEVLRGPAQSGRAPALPMPAPQAQARLQELERIRLALEAEVVQHRRAEELARSQSQLLIQSMGILATESDLDAFLGHVLKVTVQQLDGVGGTLWFPDALTGTSRLHLEYLNGRVIQANESHHPAVLHPPPVGGRGISTFPVEHAETYVLSEAVAGMPEENRAYIYSLGVRTLLTVPMLLGKETVGWICVRSAAADLAELEGKIHVAEALAIQATLAVQMARLAAQAREGAVLAERNRIARDIHDTLAQGFTGVVLNLEAASRTLRKSNYAAAQEHIELAQGLAQSCLAEARLSVSALRPDEDRHAELQPRLRAQVERLRAAGIEARFDTIGAALRLPASVEAELVRIAQESITNVLKHARAARVQVCLTYGPQRVSLRVQDDGAGFDAAIHHDGFGLIGMRERAGRIGARLLVSSTAGAGTRVETLLETDAVGAP